MSCVIVRVSVVFRKTVIGDRCFDSWAEKDDYVVINVVVTIYVGFDYEQKQKLRGPGGKDSISMELGVV